MVAADHMWWVLGICLSCLAFGHSGLYLIGALCILVAGLIIPTIGSEKADDNGSAKKVGFADLGWFPIQIDVDGGSPLAKTYRALMNLFKPATYLLITKFFLKTIKWFLGIQGDEFRYWTIFKRVAIFYFLIIPLPAAFLAPVGYPQAQADLQLMTAGILFILTNAVGDVISLRITIHNFSKIITYCSDLEPVDSSLTFQQGLKIELKIYLTTLKDLGAALLVLCAVLMISSVMFGVQVGEYSFGTDQQTLAAMWDRTTRFYELVFELYWFRSPDGMPQGNFGVPGMFLYGITTFLPTMVMLLSAILWTLTIPLRIILQLPKSKLYRIISAELSVFAICVVVSGLLDLRIQNLYSFLTTI